MDNQLDLFYVPRKTPIEYSLVGIPKRQINLLKSRGHEFVEDINFNTFCLICGYIGIGPITRRKLMKIVEQNKIIKA